MTQNEPFLGIDFGTAYSAMAWVHPETGQADIICNEEGEEKTRSAVYFGNAGTEVGRFAEQYLEDETEASRVLVSVKRDLVKKTVSGHVDGRTITPQDVAVRVFAKLKRDAEKTNFHSPVRRAVVTVPTSFDPLQKDAIKDVACQAGFDQVEMLDEPVAAAIAYLKAGLNVGRRILVFDLGAGTFDTAILDRDDDDDLQPFHIALEPRGQQVGGDDFDRALMNHVVDKLPTLGEDRRLTSLLLHRCRCCKEALSHREKHALAFPLLDGTTLRHEIRRETFEDLIGESVASMVRLSAELAELAEGKGGAVDTLVLIGGSVRVPLVARLLGEAVPLEPRPWHRQDVAVALGAAYYGEILWGARAAKKYHQTLHNLAREKELTIRSLRRTQQERKRLDLSASLAEAIEQEEIHDTVDNRLARALAEAKAKYRQAVQDVAAREMLESELLGSLTATAQQNGLTGEEAEAIEREILGDTKELIFDRQQAERSERARAFLTNARDFFTAVRLDEALEQAQAACDADPQLPEGYLLKTEILAKQEKWELAESAASACLRLRPNDSSVRYQRGRCRLEAKKYKEALADFDAVLQSDLSGDRWRYRWRAVARSHLRDVAGAVSDLEAAAEDPEGCLRDGTPVAALWTVCGLLCDQRNPPSEDDPEKAFDCLSKALAQRPAAAEERPCRDFLVCFGTWCDTSLPIGPFLQQRLWGLSRRLHHDDLARAVERFDAVLRETKAVLVDSVWNEDRDFGVEIVKLSARRQDPTSAKKWVGRLVEKFDLDVSLLQNAPEVQSCKALVNHLTPRWSYTEDHGAFLNQLTVKNDSPFSVKDILVSVRVVYSDGRETSFQKRKSTLAAGTEHTWNNVFKDGGFGGSKIGYIEVTLCCRQGEGVLGPANLSQESAQRKNFQRLRQRPGNAGSCPNCGKTAWWDGKVCTWCDHKKGMKLKGTAKKGESGDSIHVTCKNCGRVTVCHPGNVGKRVRCMHCKSEVIVDTSDRTAPTASPSARSEAKLSPNDSTATSSKTTASSSAGSSGSSDEWKWFGPVAMFFLVFVVLPWLRGCFSDAAKTPNGGSRAPLKIESVETVCVDFKPLRADP